MSIIKRYNPFHYVIGGRFARHATTLRTSLRGKFMNATAVLSGLYEHDNPSIFAAKRKTQAGILDYATLFIIPLISLARYKLDEAYNNRNLPNFIRYFAGGLDRTLMVPHLLLQLTTYVIAIVLTIATSFVTAIVHGISKLVKNSLKAEAKKIEFTNDSQERLTRDDKAKIYMSKNSYQLIFKDWAGKSFQTKAVALENLSAPQTQQEKSAAAFVKLNKFKVADLMEEVIDSKATYGSSSRRGTQVR